MTQAISKHRFCGNEPDTPWEVHLSGGVSEQHWDNPVESDGKWSELRVRARLENGRLTEKTILCPECGGEVGKFIGCGGKGEECALLACTQCQKRLAEFSNDAEMERNLEELWRVVQPYLLRASKNTTD
ncbi:MAG: hypothetical protein DMG39_13125 [Acidobacteria bacterium]|nr:MAG: hypothetical protein DMG39_13125 [Acidobacteriota bacterium]